MRERKDRLRRRPNNIRYFYLAVSNVDIHTGVSWGGLDYVRKHYTVSKLFVADLLTGLVHEITKPIDDFMEDWRNNYNDVSWDVREVL